MVTWIQMPFPDWWRRPPRAHAVKLPWGQVLVFCPRCLRTQEVSDLALHVTPYAEVHMGCECGIGFVFLAGSVHDPWGEEEEG